MANAAWTGDMADVPETWPSFDVPVGVGKELHEAANVPPEGPRGKVPDPPLTAWKGLGARLIGG